MIFTGETVTAIGCKSAFSLVVAFGAHPLSRMRSRGARERGSKNQRRLVFTPKGWDNLAQGAALGAEPKPGFAP
jgi:hypothetical protein